MNASLRHLFVLTAFVTACQNRPTSDGAASAETKVVETSSVSMTCYTYVSATDTIQMSLTRTGDAVTGDLTYQLREKDRNTGTLIGQMRGDTLVADYTFRSEGLESVREVAFLVNGGRVVEGYGPQAARNGKVAFSNQANLSFSSSFVLTEATCAN